MTAARQQRLLVAPVVRTGAGRTVVPTDLMRLLERVVVDTSTQLPAMFEITFTEWDPTALRTFAIGTEVTVASEPVARGIGAPAVTVVEGEVTAIEAEFSTANRMVIRGYTADHRLQRLPRSRTFIRSTDADVARRVAGEHGIPIGQITATRSVHEHIGQVNQTDWDFLRTRADAIGYDFGVRDGRFFFTPTVDAGRGRTVSLILHDTLVRFAPRITAGNLAPQSEVRVWNPATAKTHAEVVPTASTSTTLPDADPAALAGRFVPRTAPPPPGPGASRMGPAPSTTAHVAGQSPVASGAAIGAVAREAARGLAEHHGSTVAEAVGDALGDPALVAGSIADVAGAGPLFSGRWAITRAAHTWDIDGYRTHFEISGRHRRTLLGMATGGAAGGARTTGQRIDGVVCGVVSDIGDPTAKRRVRVALPWLAPSFVTDWAPVAQLGGGTRTGLLLYPEVGDEVLVAFEFGDPRRPYVLAVLVPDEARFTLGGEPVLKRGATASVAWRGLVTPSGNRLAFHDEIAPGATTAQASDLVLGTAGAELALIVDQTAGTVTLRCDPRPPGSRAATGTLTIECGKAGNIDIRAGQGGSVTVDGGARLILKAQASVDIESPMINIKGSGPVQVKGNPIKLN